MIYPQIKRYEEVRVSQQKRREAEREKKYQR